MRRALAVGLLLTVTFLAAGCGGDSESETSGPVLTSFDAGGVDCSEGSLGTVFVSWSAANANKVEIVVDGGDPTGADPSGALTLTVPCDGDAHEVTITPLGDDGPGEPETRTVSS